MFAVLLRTIRNEKLFRFIGVIALAIALIYFLLWIFFRQESLVQIVDQLIFGAVLGLGIIWFAAIVIPKRIDWKSRLTRYGFIAFGAAAVFASSNILFLDFARPRVVLEGRVENVRPLGGAMRERGANIAGRTVKATAPVYDRLKFNPYVRVEVGRGSEYIYKIDYLRN